MVDTKELIYKKACTELNEVIKRLSDGELSKIPHQVIENIKANMDTKYVWEYDDNKKIEEQDFLVETKAIIVEIYERYLCPEEEKEFWKKYDQICLNMIEDKKREEYNPDNVFRKDEKVQEDIKETEEIREKQGNNLPVEIKKEGLFRRIINYFKNFLKVNK